MKRITAPIRFGESGDAIANLHDALFFILRKREFRPDGRDEARWRAELDTEIQNREFAGRTLRLLNAMQHEIGLPESEIINVDQAERLNHVLDELGAFAEPVEPPQPPEPPEPPPELQYLVRGQILYWQGRFIEGAIVRAYNKELRTEDLLGEAITDVSGNYEIFYSPDRFSRPKQFANLQVRAFRREGEPPTETLLGESPILPKARPVEKVRIHVEGGPETRWSEFEQLKAEVEPRLGGLKVEDLTETAKEPDVSLLAGELGQHVSRVASFVVAHKMSAKTNVAPEVYYGLLRRNQPGNLSRLLSQNVVTQRVALQQALDRNIVPGHLTGKLNEAQSELRKQIVHYAVEMQTGPRSLNTLMSGTLESPEEKKEFLSAFVENAEDPQKFWEKIESSERLRDKAPRLRLNLQLAALTGKHAPLLQELQRRSDAGEFQAIRDLAGRTQEQWKDMILNLQTPEDQLFPPGIPTELNKDQKATVYAKTLTRIMADAFPTEAFAHKIQEDEEEPQQMRDFFRKAMEAAPDFHLLKTDIRKFVKDQPAVLEGIEHPEAVIQRVQSAQRLRKLVHMDEMTPLSNAGLDSSLAIANMDRTGFIRKFEGELGTGRARAIHSAATQNVAEILNYFANYSPVFNNIPLPVLNAPVQEGIPNLETLFGSFDLCACKECNSVYGPAAYFTELLAYLQERPQAAGTTRDVLFQRRPDLGEIELTCENTNTVLPYIDLVLESLEELVAPFSSFVLPAEALADLDNEHPSDTIRAVFESKQRSLGTEFKIFALAKGAQWRISDRRVSYRIEKVDAELKVVSATNQTSGTPEDLSIEPQHTNAGAYEVLRRTVSSPALPLDLWWEEGSVYLNFVQVQRSELMKDFSTAPSVLLDLNVATERLRLTRLERELITDGEPVRVASDADIPQLTGLLTIDGVALQANDLVLVKDQAASEQNGVYRVDGGFWTRKPEFNDHLLTIQEGTANKGTSWLFAPTGPKYNKVNEWDFWGLAQTGNSMEVFDKDQKKFATHDLTWAAALRQVRVITHSAGITYEALLDLLRSKYVNPDGLVRIVSADPEDKVTCDTSKLVLSVSDDPLFSDELDPAALGRMRRFLRLLRKLHWSPRDLDAAIAGPKIDAAVILKLANLAELQERLGLEVNQILDFYSNFDPGSVQAVALSRKLKVPMEDLVILVDLAGLNPLDAAHTENSIHFLDLLEQIRGSGFSIPEWNYFLRDQATEASGLLIDETLQAEILTQLRSELRKIQADTQLRPDPTGELVRKSLVQLGFAQNVIEHVINTLNGSVVYEQKVEPWPAGSLVVPRQIANRVSLDPSTKMLQVTGPLTLNHKTKLSGITGPGPFEDAVSKIFDEPRKFLKDTLNLDSTDTAAMFNTEAPTPADRFQLVQKKLFSKLRATLSRNAVIQGLSEALRIDARIVEALLVRTLNSAENQSEKAIQDFLKTSFAESDSNVEVTNTAFPFVFQSLKRLQKIAQFITRFKLKFRQVDWMEQFSATVNKIQVPWLGPTSTAGWLNWNDVPVAPKAEAVPGALFAGLRLSALMQIQNSIPRGEIALEEIFSQARTGIDVEVLLDIVSARTGWDRAELKSLVKRLGATLPQGLLDESLLMRFRACFRNMRRLSTGAETCFKICSAELSSETVNEIRKSLRRKYEGAEWYQVARPLADKIRARRRDALVAYLLIHGDAASKQSWKNSNELYAHILMDPEMEPCMMTSRIKHAIGSVQLFVQRCRLNLEKDNGAIADENVDAGWRQWKWMKNYRIWEANRKIFLYPENWLEPELRDDKTPFFKELESALMQGDVNDENVEEAYIGYLEKLDSVALLELVGMYSEAASGGKPETLHVFGRSHNVPPAYYYRRLIGGARWTPWERVDLDIGNSPLLPIVWNRRLYVFWLDFRIEAEEQPSGSDAPQAAQKYFMLQLAWSEYKRGKFGPKKVLNESLKVRSKVAVAHGIDEGRENHTLRAQVEGAGLKIWYEYDDPEEKTTTQTGYGGQKTTVKYAEVMGWHFTGCNGHVKKIPRPIYGIYQPAGTIVDGMRFMELGGFAISMSINIMGIHLTPDITLNMTTPLMLPRENNASEDTALAATPGRYRLLYPHQEGKITGNRPFFYQDDERAFYVVPEAMMASWFREKWVSPFVSALDPDIVTQHYYQAEHKPDPLITAARKKSRDYLPVEQARMEVRLQQGATPVMAQPVMAGPAMPAVQPAVKSTRNNQFLIDKGARLRVPVSDYIQNEHIFESGYLLPLSKQERRYTFYTHFHPYVCSFIEELNRAGLDRLFYRDLQGLTASDFKSRYQPTVLVKSDKYPIQDVDFTYAGAYSQYNWELFFHIPLLIACRLMQNQRFEEAQRWFHYIFDPTDTSKTDVPGKYWKTRPFYEQTRPEYLKARIDQILKMLATGASDPELERQVAEWRENPFKPHVIARLRITAYQKSVVMKYLDNLLDWGDLLFKRDTIESINEAAQIYILAAEILGPLPEIIAPRAEPRVHTFNTLAPELKNFSIKMVEMENILPPPNPDTVVVSGEDTPLPIPKVPYFCLPPNDKLMNYWNKVADRLFKIRHCMNIEGMVRQLPLFEPPIDPALLVRAAAAGVDISSVLNDATAPRPHYRFSVLSQKVTELCGELKSLAASLLSALEKRDAEQLGLMRAKHEQAMLDLVKNLKEDQVKEAQQNLVVLRRARAAAVTRYMHYQRLLGVSNPTLPVEGQPVPDQQASANASIQNSEGVKMTQHEKSQFASMNESRDSQEQASAWSLLANALHMLPTLSFDVKPWGVGTGLSFFLGLPAEAAAAQSRDDSTSATTAASQSSGLSQFVLREHDWVLQSNLAAKDIMHIDQQIVAGVLREEFAKKERDNHYKQQEQAAEIEEFLRTKYTNRELYDWMLGQLSALYFQSYQLVYDWARRAERVFRLELGVADSNYIQFGYWDNLRKGLLAAERLYGDVKRMEVAYLDGNKREHEMSKHVSLAALNPEALISLRTKGECYFKVPEVLFDLDHPGHYRRRIRSVSISIPSITGPYTSVSAKLTLMGNRYRAEAMVQAGTPYPYQGIEDKRWVQVVGGIESIVTSGGREDAGLFELNLRDERLLPFEGAGAISAWRLELPDPTKTLLQFDYNTITDVILHIRYTASDAGELLKEAALGSIKGELEKMESSAGKAGLFRFFSLRHDFPSAWQKLMFPQLQAPEPVTELPITRQHFPYFTQTGEVRIEALTFFIQLKRGVTYGDALVLKVKPPTGTEKTVKLDQISGELGELPHGTFSPSPDVIVEEGASWSIKATAIPEQIARTIEVNGQPVTRLDPEKILEIGMIAKYTF